LVIVGTALIFLVSESRPALSSSGIWHFFTSSDWSPGTGHFGVSGVLMGTIILATTALLVGFPLAIAMAIFINEYAPSRVRAVLTSVIDLLAAVPSLLFGMWGLYAFQARLVPVARWMSEHLAAFPFLRVPDSTAVLTQSSFVAGVVIGIMVIPIITSVSRDVMAQAPREQCEGALALGGTRWGMIRTVILPFGRSGIIGATLLGFGRALGETITAAILLSVVFKVNWHVLLIGGGSVPALIATKFGEASELERSALVASGLALFILTLGVNLAARRVVDRKTPGR
jgi:phosphate transport system permease protein